MSDIRLAGEGGSNPLKGIGLKVVSVAVFVAMATFIKLAGQLPAGQIVFFRSFFALIPLVVVLAHSRELRTAFHTNRPQSHVLRGVVGVSSMALGFFALTRLPLPEAVTLNYAQPLLVVVISALFLGETIRVFRWSAAVVGLVGVVIISWPNLSLFTAAGGLESDEALGVAAALLSAAISAVALLLIRRLVQTERTATIVIWFSTTASVLALLTLPFGWVWLTTQQLGFLVAAGIFGGVGQLLMTQSYRYAEASTVAPFEYTSMLLAIAVGFWVFGDLPTLHTVVGGVIVVGAGIFIIWREHALGLERGRARRVSPPQ